MRFTHLALVATTALILAVPIHAIIGSTCAQASDCSPAACCDSLTGECGAGPEESVVDGNPAARSCECELGNRFNVGINYSVCGVCSSDLDCDGDHCCDLIAKACSVYATGSVTSGPVDFGCACAPGSIHDFAGQACGVPLGCNPTDSVCDDPHMRGLRGQHIDWSGVDGGWYSLINDDKADLHINIRLTAPLSEDFPDRQLVTGLGIVSEGHSLTIEVKHPYTIDTDGCKKGTYPCLANGGLRALVDEEEADGVLVFSRGEYVAGDIAVSASNLPVECRQFGADKIWANMYEEMLQGKRSLVEETIEDWILKSQSMAAPEWCSKYIAENDLGELQSTHAIFKIETSTVAVRLNVGVNYQGGGELDWDGRVLPDLEFWQMDVGLDGLNIENPSLSGILGETARPVHDKNGVEVMEGFEAFRGTVEDYRVSGSLGTHFALLDNLEERQHD